MKKITGKKTMKPIKNHKNGTKQANLSAFVKQTLSTLGTGSMREAVKLPAGEDLNEWISVNTLDFYNEISLMYGALEGICTEESCPEMTAGKNKYLWADGVKVKKPISVPAVTYVDNLLVWVESQLNDESLFPIEYGAKYPKNFLQVVGVIYKRYFRVYGHIYHSHLKDIESCGASAHLNTCFKHLVYFIQEFDLVPKREFVPLQSLIDRMCPTESEKKE